MGQKHEARVMWKLSLLLVLDMKEMIDRSDFVKNFGGSVDMLKNETKIKLSAVNTY